MARKYQLWLDVIELSKNDPVREEIIIKSIVFLTGLERPKNATKNHVANVSSAILACGSRYIKMAKGSVRRKDITKRSHSLIVSFFERITAVNIVTVTLAISDG